MKARVITEYASSKSHHEFVRGQIVTVEPEPDGSYWAVDEITNECWWLELEDFEEIIGE